MQRTRVVARLLGLAFAVLPLARAGAQTSTSNLRGYVTGAGGAPVADVQVAARAVDINQTRGAITNASGFYYIGGLRPGRYEITMRRVGFQSHDGRIFETLTGRGGILVAIRSEPRAADALALLHSYGGGNPAIGAWTGRV